MEPLTGLALWLRLVTIAALWGAAFPLIRYLAAYLPPFALAGLRGALAAVVVFLFLWFRRELGGITRSVLVTSLVLGLLSGVIPNTLLPMALQRMEAAPASLVQAAGPLIVTLLAALLLKGETPTPRMLSGIGLGFLGIALVVGAGGLGGASAEGALLILAATFSYALSTIWVRRANRGPAAALALGQQAVSGILSGSLALMVDGPGALVQPPQVWAVAMVLAIFATAVPLTLFLGLAMRARAADSAMVGYLQPVFSTAIAAAWLGEVPSWQVVAGGGVVLASVWLVTSRPKAASRHG
ncbi:DMT family transporter [Neoroseomonas oryzicola]|uniref:DMT family transporter n=1 Tax=Neoroseomonas oryzicola TaxID=535904 RepID=A0A9X9WIJ8_9PROT|nr:DMT family transporter [Neoroseomonas oryzicola]MBR0660158.1 DMT family transporter [Neoroseomonas oryzicola]NKE19409.1 DMT family transporter [Neoroseomonas oryzicola]